MKKTFFLFFIFIPSFLFTQSDTTTDPGKLTYGYKTIKLGMSMSEVENQIETALPEINIKRNEILQTRLQPDTEILTVEGWSGFIIEGFFHFKDNKLFQIILKIDKNKIGYYMILKRFTDRFGNPDEFDPEYARWQDKFVILTLEKPCTLKYQDKPVWEQIQSEYKKEDYIIDHIREDFLDNL